MSFFHSPMGVLVTFIVLLGIGLMFIMSRNLDYRSELCTDKKGMMVRTEKGWKCLDVKELQ
jgi:hypothetical protein